MATGRACPRRVQPSLALPTKVCYKVKIAWEGALLPAGCSKTMEPGDLACSIQDANLFREDFFKELQGSRVVGLAEPEHRLLAHGVVGVVAGDADEQRDAFVLGQLA